jgi:hypothetical protein
MTRSNGSEPKSRERRSVDRRRHWIRLISEWKRSGLSQVKFCGRREVAIQTFRWWKSRLSAENRVPSPKTVERKRRTSSAKSSLVPVEVVEPSVACNPIEIVCGARTVRLQGDFSPDLLEKVVRTLEALSC